MENSSVLKSKKKKKRIITILIILFILFFGRPYYKPAYSGRVVDFETGEPIAGVYIRVNYWSGHYGLIEQNTNLIKSSIYYTDKDGEFYVPSLFTLIGLFSWDSGVYFSVKKGNYTSIRTRNIQDCLSLGCEETTYEDAITKMNITISSHLIKLSRIYSK